MLLAHYTLNTGRLRMSPRSEVLESTIRALDPLVAADGGWVAGGNGQALGFRVAATGDCRVLICLAYGMPPHGVTFVTCLLAWSEDAAEEGWASMLRIAKKLSVPVSADKPGELPLLAVLIQPEAVRIPADVLMAAADLERCIAWTILAREGLAP